jgi:serine/threonine protein kinase
MEIRASTNAERWQLVESVLDRALALEDDSERQALVAVLCAEDDELRREVEELLGSIDTEGDLLEMPIADVAADIMQEIAAAMEEVESSGIAGRRLGPYRLLEVIGRGGMGVVCLAERADEHYEQRVAIKLMPQGLESAETERRFLTERQILANLEHPNIARLLDGGVTDEGYPYLVMELVEGRPIDQYCLEQRLGLEERLEVFLEVCDTVQFAHQNMVVHRDLKPSNIMVTAGGKVRLLDFGIAKLLDVDSALGQVAAGQTVFQPRTLAFASPEQIANQSVSTASDVYSLGVLLYRLLSGRSPYDVEGLPASRAEALVRESVPPLPSVAAGRDQGEGQPPLARSWIKKLAGDLDNVVARALRKDPAQRYATAEKLADELRRYQDGMPVLAQKRTRTYIAKKFVQRHRWGVATACVLALAILIGFVAVLWQARVADRERDRAQVEARKAERVAEFLGGLFEAANVNSEGAGQFTVRQMLDQGEARIQEELVDEPAVRGEMLTLMSGAYASLGDFDKGLELGEAAVKDLRGVQPGDDLALARAVSNLGSIHHGLGRHEKVQPLLLEGLDLLTKNEQVESFDGAMVYRYLGLLEWSLGNPEAAEVNLRQALRIWQKIGREVDAAGEMNNLVGALEDQGRWDEAFEIKQQTLEVLTDHYGDEHPVVATTRNNLAVSLHTQGKYDQAEVLYRSALKISERLLGSNHVSVGDHLSNLGRLLMDQGRFVEAEPFVLRAVQMRRDTVDENHFHRIAAEINLASLLRGLGELDESIVLYRASHARLESLLGSEHVATARAQSLLGQALHQSGELPEAETQLTAALRKQEEQGAKELVVAESLISLGAVLGDRNLGVQAEALLRRGLGLRLDSRGEGDWTVAEAQVELAGALIQLGELDEAAALLESGGDVLASDRFEDLWRNDRAGRFAAQLDGF